jgi:hypothetical protein
MWQLCRLLPVWRCSNHQCAEQQQLVRCWWTRQCQSDPSDPRSHPPLPIPIGVLLQPLPRRTRSLPPTQCKHMVRGTRQCKRRAAGCGADHTVCDGHQPSKLAASQTESRAAAVAGPATDVQVKKVRRSGFDTEFCIRGCHWVPTPAGFIHLGRPRSYRLMLQPVVQTLKVRKKRVSSSQKRMLNPFSFRPLPSAMIDGAVAHYTNPCLPLVVDIGSAQGRFIRRLNSSVGVGANYLGVELRNFLVEAATTAVRSLLRLPCLDGHPWWKLPPLQCVLSCGCLA